MSAARESSLTTDAPAAPARPTFEEAFSGHAAYVLGLLRRLGVDGSDVEDVAQEVFVVVHRGLATFEGRSSLKTWLCGICLRKASHYRRGRGRRRERATAVLPETRIEPAQEDALERQRLQRQLEDALEQLSEPQRQVFVLFELSELSMDEVAEAVGCTASTAYSRLYAARRLVAAHLRRTWADAPGRAE